VIPKIATTPTSAPIPETARVLAPFDAVDLAAEAVAEPEWEADAGAFEAVPDAAAGVLLAPADAVGPPMGAVDWPSIWAWTVELKVPDIPAIVNLAEKASAGYCGFAGSVAVSD